MANSPNKRLKKAVESVSGGIDAVIEQTGIAKRTLYNLFEDGKSIKSEYLIALFDNFGIRPDEILIAKSGNSINGEGVGYDAREFTSIPYYPNVQASAGGGLIAENEEALPILFRNYFISNTLRSNANNLFAMKVTGDSMQPDIRDGDLLLVDQSRDRIKSERPYVIVVGEQVRVKNLTDMGGEKIKLISKNKEYPVEEIHTNECKILGEVRYVQRTLN